MFLLNVRHADELINSERERVTQERSVSDYFLPLSEWAPTQMSAAEKLDMYEHKC